MLTEIIKTFPNTKKGAVVVLSGGMDSAIAARITIELYGHEDVHAISFYYEQKQTVELDYAKKISNILKIKHTLIDISFLGDMVKNVTSNVVDGIVMPTFEEADQVIAPPTEVPFRNGIMFMAAAAYAQSNDLELIITGIQAQDEYAPFDTTHSFVETMNKVLKENKQHNIQIHDPVQGMSKEVEIGILLQLDGTLDLLKNTITCYNPIEGISCGICPSCVKRINNFRQAGYEDVIPYHSH